MAHKDIILNKGIKKLKDDLDIVNLIEMIKSYRIIKDVMFTPQDNILIRT